MHRNKSITIIAPVLLLAILSIACSLLQPAANMPVPVETAVEATFTAQAPGDKSSPEATPTQEPTSSFPTPAPTESTPATPGEPTPTAPATSSPVKQPSGPETTPGPSVLRVVYVKDGNVWFWQEGGEPAALTSAGQAYDVRISDDGLLVAFARQVNDTHTELWAVNTDGSEERRLVSVSDLSDMDPGALAVAINRFEWIPGSHTVAYNTREVFEGPGLALYNDLRLIDADSLTHGTLLAPGDGGEFYYSSDGTQIAISTPTRLSLVNADATNRRDLVDYPAVITYSEYLFYPVPQWAPDGSMLRVAIPPEDPLAEPAQPTALWQVPVDGSPAVKTSSLPAAPFFGSEVSFSPDLKLVAYVREIGDPAANQRELHLAYPDGSTDLIYLAAPLLQFESWSPDSQHFILSTGDDRAMQMGSPSAAPAPLPDGAGVFSLDWIDANRFIYSKESPGGFELRTGSLDGKAAALIDTAAGPPPNLDIAH